MELSGTRSSCADVKHTVWAQFGHGFSEGSENWAPRGPGFPVDAAVRQPNRKIGWIGWFSGTSRTEFQTKQCQSLTESNCWQQKLKQIPHPSSTPQQKQLSDLSPHYHGRSRLRLTLEGWISRNAEGITL